METKVILLNLSKNEDHIKYFISRKLLMYDCQKIELKSIVLIDNVYFHTIPPYNPTFLSCVQKIIALVNFYLSC